MRRGVALALVIGWLIGVATGVGFAAAPGLLYDYQVKDALSAAQLSSTHRETVHVDVVSNATGVLPMFTMRRLRFYSD